MKKKNTVPIKWMTLILVVLSIIVFGVHRPLKNIPLENISPFERPKINDLSQITATTAKPINPLRSDAEILQSIAKQNEDRAKVTALLAAKAAVTAQVRQQAEAAKYQPVAAQSIPVPNTNPAPADLMAKLKSNQLMHH